MQKTPILASLRHQNTGEHEIGVVGLHPAQRVLHSIKRALPPKILHSQLQLLNSTVQQSAQFVGLLCLVQIPKHFRVGFSSGQVP